MNIRQVVAELLHEDGQKNKQTNMTKLLVPFCNFANVPKNRKMVVYQSNRRAGRSECSRELVGVTEISNK